MAGSKRLKGWQMTADIYIYVEVEKVKKVVRGLLFESRGSGTRWTYALKKNIVTKRAGKKCTRELWIKWSQIKCKTVFKMK